MALKIGCHLSVSGGYEKMGKTALSIGASTFQFFTRNPRGGSFKYPTDNDISALNKILDENEFAPVIAHAPYTLNPCGADESLREYTMDVMSKDLMLLDKIKCAYYNFHPGCHVSQGEDVGIQKTADTINHISQYTEKTLILIETMAGKGSEIGKSFEQIQKIIEKCEKKSLIGVCLDTCHVHDGGYDISNDPDAVLMEFDKIIGLDRLKAIHLNDSKNPLNAHKDRHERIGEGYMGIEGITRIIKNPIISSLPICLETPNELDGYAREIELLKQIYNS